LVAKDIGFISSVLSEYFSITVAQIAICRNNYESSHNSFFAFCIAQKTTAG